MHTSLRTTMFVESSSYIYMVWRGCGGIVLLLASDGGEWPAFCFTFQESSLNRRLDGLQSISGYCVDKSLCSTRIQTLNHPACGHVTTCTCYPGSSLQYSQPLLVKDYQLCKIIRWLFFPLCVLPLQL